MRGIFELMRAPDLASLLNIFLGFGAVLMAVQGRPLPSVALVILAAVADGMDGFLARRMEPGPLGINLDSLADAVSFGVAPAVLAWTSFGANLYCADLHWANIYWALGGVYLSCGVLRLSRFNVTPKSAEHFEGMPIPAAGMMVAISTLLDGPVLTAVLMIVLSALMISTVAYPKCRDKRQIPLVLAMAVAVGLSWRLGDVRVSAAIVFLVLVGYLTLPLVMALCRRTRI